MGTVTDYYTHEPIANAVVRYYDNGNEDSVFTDTSGYYYITGLGSGQYRLVSTKPGYAETSSTVWIDNYSSTPTSSNGGSLVEYSRRDFSLYSRSITIKGTVKLYLGPTSELRPAANFPYTLSLNNSNLTPNSFQGTTNSLGEFTITDVPDYYNIYINFNYKAVGTRSYHGSSYLYNIPPNSTAEFSTTLSSYQGPILALVSTNMDSTAGGYKTSFPVSDNLELTFNKDLSLDNTKSFGGYIKLDTYTFNLDTQVIFDGSNIVINPPIDLTNDQNYTLTYVIYSTVPGDAATGTIVFHTEK